MTRFFCLLSLFLNIVPAPAVAALAMAFANLVPLQAAAADDKRVALVIGNGAYENAIRLDNAAFDARAVADAFRKLGFQVIDGYDLDIAQMRARVSDFSAALSNATSAVIYYAGHGISVDEENYLIPTDILIKSPTDLDLNAISISLLLKQMKRDDGVNIVILDACRDNPFAAELAKHKTRSVVGERGLSRIDGDLARGTLIAFASDPKSTSLDGPAGQHSPFTEAFLAHVFDPNVSIDTIMSRVRVDVWEKTRHVQLPWVNTSLIGEYTLNAHPPVESVTDAKAPASPASSTVQTTEKQAQEDLLWESAQHSNLSADYQAYLDAFPNGVFAQMAKNRIASLKDAGASGAARAPRTIAMTEPVGPSETDRKEDLGTAETEKGLDLSPAGENEVQQRLIVLQFYKGPATGTLDASTRSALAEWQKQRGFAPTSFLDSPQLAVLRAESELEYRKRLAAQPAPAQTPRRAVVTQAPKPANRATKAPAPAPRHIARRSPHIPATTAESAAPVTPSDPGGSPAWRKRAGLPDTPGTPDMGGRPPGFWTRPANF